MHHADLQAIFDDFNINFVEDPDFLIKFYEDNEHTLSSATWFDHDELFKYQSIASWYLWALMEKKKYSKMRENANSILLIVEKNIENLKVDPLADFKYHNLIKQRAYANYFRFQFRAAGKEFLRLSQYNPQNKNYKMWADMSFLRFYSVLLYCLSSLIIFGDSYYKKYLPFPFAIAPPAIGILCCAWAWRLEIKAKHVWKSSQSPLRKV